MCPTAAAAPTRPPADQREEKKMGSGWGRHLLNSSKLAEATPSNEEGGGQGTLVLHVRSGDVFSEAPLSSYGQVQCEVFREFRGAIFLCFFSRYHRCMPDWTDRSFHYDMTRRLEGYACGFVAERRMNNISTR